MQKSKFNNNLVSVPHLVQVPSTNGSPQVAECNLIDSLLAPRWGIEPRKGHLSSTNITSLLTGRCK